MSENFLTHELRTDNGLAGTYTKTYKLPQGVNTLVGIQFWGGTNTWVRVYDGDTATNSALRFSFYTTANAQNWTINMTFHRKTMLLQMVTPGQGYYGFVSTIRNVPAVGRWIENPANIRKPFT